MTPLLVGGRRGLSKAALPVTSKMTRSPRRMAALLKVHVQTQRINEADANRITEWLLQLESWRYQPDPANTAAALGTLQREFKRLPWPARLRAPSPLVRPAA